MNPVLLYLQKFCASFPEIRLDITGKKLWAGEGTPLADFNSAQETAYLLGNPANAAHLLESLAQVEQGEMVSCPLDEL